MHYQPIIFDRAESEFHLQKGEAVALQPEALNPASLQYHYVSPNRPRDFDTALYERVRRPFKEGLLTSNGFDDRKVRFDHWGYYRHTEGKHHIVFFIGPAIFQEFRVYEQQFFNCWNELAKRGKELHSDERAFTCQVLAVDTLPIAKDGIMIFKRSPKICWADHYHSIGGLVDADVGDLIDGNPMMNLDVICRKQARVELEEEAGITDTKLEFQGFVDGGTTLDASYVLRSQKSVDQLLCDLTRAKDKDDHVGYKVLRGRHETEAFLSSDIERTPHLEGALRLLLAHRGLSD
jgi:hypothetical protein